MKHLISFFSVALISLITHAQTTLPYKPEVVLVKGGTFKMGSTVEEDATPHTVTLSSYSIGKYPVTVVQYKYYCTATGISMPDEPSWGWIDSHPIVNVTYEDAMAYCDWLAEEMDANYRLPTEAEWEFAARGGNKSNNYTYSGSNDAGEVAWYKGNSNWERTEPVGTKKANELGIFDMSGNAWQWCKDRYGDYSAIAQINPKGATKGIERVLRGGSWFNPAGGCSVTHRNSYQPLKVSTNFGFRVALSK